MITPIKKIEKAVQETAHQGHRLQLAHMLGSVPLGAGPGHEKSEKAVQETSTQTETTKKESKE
eukprot:11050308-Heterocapsa_arctica.AAC.1